LEARHPLFDLDLVELSLRLPPLATFDRYRSRPLLRNAMAGLLPDAVRLRPQKALFDSVLLDCLDGADGAAAFRLLSDPRAELRAYVDQRCLADALSVRSRQRREQPFRWMWQLWRLTTAECWLRAQGGAGGETLRARIDASPARVSLRPVHARATEFA
jgi:asparagine synthase (glutamine-hydrolysing)